MKEKSLSLLLCAMLIGGVGAVAFSRTGLMPQQGNQNTQKPKSDDDDDEDEDEADSPAEKAKLAKQAKITMERAREIALARVPGTVEEAELEREKGKLVYSFDIRNDRGTITEVEVNATDGTVVSVEEEDEQEEAEEQRREESKKTGKKRP